jgi:hypothetical protein
MNKNVRNSNQAIQMMAGRNLAKAVVRAKQVGQNVAAIEEMTVNGKTNSDKITMQVVNASAVNTYDLVFGTPVGIADEYTAVPYSTTLPNIMFTGLADLSDNQGVGIPFLQLVNKRIVRKPIYVSHIEVITPNNPTGNSQKSEPVTKFVVPYNSATDNAAINGSYIPQYTEYTAVSLLDSGMVLGEFSGFHYSIIPLGDIKLNIYISAIDTPTFIYR